MTGPEEIIPLRKEQVQVGERLGLDVNDPAVRADLRWLAGEEPRCPQCGAEVETEAQGCPDCGFDFTTAAT